MDFVPKSQKLVQTNIDFATINVLKTTSNVCATVAIRLHIRFYIKNNESWNWFVTANVEVFPGKVDTKFCKCLHFDFKQPIFEFFERFEAKMTVLEIYFLGLENDRKTECSIFNWEFLKVLVLWVTASQQVNLSTIKKTKFAGKKTLPQRPMKHF